MLFASLKHTPEIASSTMLNSLLDCRLAIRDALHHNQAMIISFQHKGLRTFYETGSTKGIRADHAKRLARLLPFLDRAVCPDDIDMPGWRLHPLKGNKSGF